MSNFDGSPEENENVGEFAADEPRNADGMSGYESSPLAPDFVGVSTQSAGGGFFPRRVARGTLRSLVWEDSRDSGRVAIEFDTMIEGTRSGECPWTSWERSTDTTSGEIESLTLDNEGKGAKDFD